MHERDFIHSLARRYPASNSVRVGIGDDGAVLDVPGNQQVVVTDMLLDGVHFDLRQHALSLVGRKSVAVNLSDLAAMGCRPTAAFVSIAIPKQSSAPAIKFPEQIYDGIDELARQFDFVVAGGDTNVWTGPFAINVCLTGVPYVASQVFLRSSARPDDVICVSGPLGGSLLSDRHLTFTPRLDLARDLAGAGCVNSAMDISDGLAIDLHRLCEASQVGAQLELDCIPIHSDALEQARSRQGDRTELSADTRAQTAAFQDGEDFELLVTMPQSSWRDIQSSSLGQQLIRIGTVQAELGCRLVLPNGDIRNLPPLGWEHTSRNED